MQIIQLQYIENSAIFFEQIKDYPYAVYLDSSWPNCTYGRYDIMSALPSETITTIGNKTTITCYDSTKESINNPFDILREILNKYPKPKSKLPFNGGAIGYFSYDLGRQIETLPTDTKDDINIPEMIIGIYDWAIIIDHKEQNAILIYQENDLSIAPTITEITNNIKTITTTPKQENATTFQLTSDLIWEEGFNTYAAALTKINSYIHNGDCYQVNYAQRLCGQFTGSPWDAYKKLQRKNPAPYSSYINTPYGEILSSSPEQFLQLTNSTITTKPIKGTSARSTDKSKDKELAEQLKNCDKNRAENLMIVDLLRNDIGKVCQPGTIDVTKLFEIESFEEIHHLVSTITGEIAPQYNATDLLKACFPGGSITGAPKIRAMEIIEELESYRRGIYCGSIGYIDYNGNMDTSITIRTAITTKDNRIVYWAGGGIVAGSTIEDEYQEMKNKAHAFVKAVLE